MKSQIFVTAYCLVFLSSSLLFFSCKRSKKDSEYDFKIVNSKKLEIKLKTKIDTINLSLNFSEKGIYQILNDTIVIVDELYKRIDFFNCISGKNIGSFEYFDKLRNPIEMNQSIFFDKYNNGYVLMNGRKVTFYNNKMDIDTTIRLKFKKSSLALNLLDFPDPNSMDLYEINYRKRRYTKLNKFYLVTIESEHPKFNAYESIEYYKTGNCFGVVHLDSRSVYPSKILKSELYSDTCCNAILDWSSATYNKKEEEIHVQFPLDSNIYVYDSKLRKKYKYGIANGKIPKSEIVNSLDIAFDEGLFKELEQKSSGYESIFYISNSNLIVRNFIDHNNKTQYLQIFNENNLILENEISYEYEIFGSNNKYLFAKIKNSNKVCRIYFE